MSRRRLFTVAAFAIIADMIVNLAGVTVLPDAWWAVIAVVACAALTVCVVAWATRWRAA